jgi:hypothetical protein
MRTTHYECVCKVKLYKTHFSFWILNSQTEASIVAVYQPIVAVYQPIINMKVQQPAVCYSLWKFHLMFTEAHELHAFVHADVCEYTYICAYVHQYVLKFSRDHTYTYIYM